MSIQVEDRTTSPATLTVLRVALSDRDRANSALVLAEIAIAQAEFAGCASHLVQTMKTTLAKIRGDK